MFTALTSVFVMLLAGAQLALAQTASVTPPSIDITSFHYVEQPAPGAPRNNTAEICGVVRGILTGAEKVLIVVDPKYNPGDYVSAISPRGNFCLLVNTLTGRIEYGLVGAQNQTLVELKELKP